MKYKILRGILIAGVVLGFGSGFAHVGAHWARHKNGQHPHWGHHCPDKDRDQTAADTKPDAKPAPTAAKPAPAAAKPAPAAAKLTPSAPAAARLAPTAPAVL